MLDLEDGTASAGSDDRQEVSSSWGTDRRDLSYTDCLSTGDQRSTCKRLDFPWFRLADADETLAASSRRHRQPARQHDTRLHALAILVSTSAKCAVGIFGTVPPAIPSHCVADLPWRIY